MKPKQRQLRIQEIVGRYGETSVEALALEFGVSAETIRRDLFHLASTGALQKVRGGARRLRLSSEGSYQERVFEHAEAKAQIAQKLAEIIEPGDTVFIDTGTTTLACADALAAISGLTVITNSLRIAQVLGRSDGGASIYLLGGGYGADNAETVGPMAIEQIARFQADHAVLTIAALDPDVGAMDANFDEAQVARAMIDNAGSTIVVAHVTKLGRRAAFRVCGADEIDMLVCNVPPDAAFAASMKAANVELR